MSKLLKIDRLGLAIGGKPILRAVSLDVARGEVVGIVGESGSGKSMTALAVMGLLPGGSATTGRIVLGGTDLLGLGEKQLRDLRGREIGMIFQEPMTALNPLQTIRAQVAETILVHEAVSRAEAHRRASEVLERVGLPSGTVPHNRYPHELSGGQRQRVVIAIAVALKPRLIIADEPTTALDVTTQARILDLLRDLVAEDGASLILISHDLAVVADMADKIVIMRDGKVVDAGPTATLFDDLRSDYSKMLIEASSHVPARARREQAPDKAPVLKLDGVVRDYEMPRKSPFGAKRTHRAVNGVGFEIANGENVGLVGESGCGKSTLARAILALEPVQAGRIEIGGDSLTEAATQALPMLRRRVQVVFQDPYGSFNPRHRTGRIVAEPFHLYGAEVGADERRQRVAEALEQVGLSARDADKYPHEFSGGQRQRIAIARAIVTRPSLVVLDEAVSALDVSVRARVLDLLARLSDELSISYLFISHDLSVVRTITDRVLIMCAGEIVEQGPTDSVFSAPQHPYSKALIEAAPVLERSLKRFRDN